MRKLRVPHAHVVCEHMKRSSNQVELAGTRYDLADAVERKARRQSYLLI